MNPSHSDQTTPALSVVVPAYNEAENLPELHRRLTETLSAMGISYEILFVDDGSRDATPQIIQGLFESDGRVRALRLSRNFGHHIAISAGLDHARGEVVAVMDADLQDRPEDLPRLYEKLNDGFDVVFGEREERRDSFFKRTTSSIFISLMNRLVKTGAPVNSAIFRVMRRPVVESLRKFREKDRFITGLVSWCGYRQTGIPVTHDARFAGKTKYDFWRMLRLALNTITAFSWKPLQIATWFGFCVSGFSFLFALYLVYLKIVKGVGILGWPSTMVTILFLGGVQLIFLGVIGEYIGRIYSETQNRPLYLVEKNLDRGGREE